jgi:Zn finger protein HypA/HybF involved in hydrogenase expression
MIPANYTLPNRKAPIIPIGKRKVECADCRKEWDSTARNQKCPECGSKRRVPKVQSDFTSPRP